MLPVAVQTVYANLLQAHLNRPAFKLEGAPTRIQRDGKAYWYGMERTTAGPRRRYLGPDTEEMRARISAMRADRDNDARFRRNCTGMVAQLRAAGQRTIDRQTGKILRALTASGVFRLGGTLIGTHAYRHYDLELGANVTAAEFAVTDDLDIASFEKLSMTLEDSAEPDLPLMLTQLGFKQAMSLHAERSPRWIMADGSYMIDFLTPSFSDTETPRKLVALNVWAQSLHYLNYLIQEPIPAVALYMEGLLIQIPRPERFAIHKLIVSQRRPAASRVKAGKDVAQARNLILALAETRPIELAEAWRDARRRGAAWRETLDRALVKAPDLAGILKSR